jgi:hypothetical protein
MRFNRPTDPHVPKGLPSLLIMILLFNTLTLAMYWFARRPRQRAFRPILATYGSQVLVATSAAFFPHPASGNVELMMMMSFICSCRNKK